jgi:RNA polymerase sigma factor (sigma-70 family)
MPARRECFRPSNTLLGRIFPVKIKTGSFNRGSRFFQLYISSDYRLKIIMLSNKIVIKFSEGDEKAFREIYYHYYNYVYHIANRILKQRNKSEDVIADVFTSIWLHRGRFDNSDELEAYLIVCVRNKCFNILRDNKRREDWEKKAATFCKETHVDPDKTFKIFREDTALAFIYNIAERLKVDYKVVFFLYYSDGESAVAIAQHLNLPRQTIFYRLKNSRLFIKEEIKKFPFKIIREYNR